MNANDRVDVGLYDYVLVIGRRWRLVLAITCLFLGFSAWGYMTWRPVYTVHAVILLRGEAVEILGRLASRSVARQIGLRDDTIIQVAPGEKMMAGLYVVAGRSPRGFGEALDDVNRMLGSLTTHLAARREAVVEMHARRRQAAVTQAHADVERLLASPSAVVSSGAFPPTAPPPPPARAGRLVEGPTLSGGAIIVGTLPETPAERAYRLWQDETQRADRAQLEAVRERDVALEAARRRLADALAVDPPPVPDLPLVMVDEPREAGVERYPVVRRFGASLAAGWAFGAVLALVAEWWRREREARACG